MLACSVHEERTSGMPHLLKHSIHKTVLANRVQAHQSLEVRQADSAGFKGSHPRFCSLEL